MIIEKVHIKKFRGFNDVEFDMGQQITIIAGQNGTQKTTLLGMLSQPFSLRNHETMKDARPLCGGSYISAFSDKFKLSTNFDKPGDHEWTLFLYNPEEYNAKTPYTLHSMPRDKNTTDKIRFWPKSRAKGSGYIHLPTIYLSLKRLFPIGEDDKIAPSDKVELTNEENELYRDLHDKILLMHSDEIIESNYLESSNKNTLGVNTNYYDWQQNSAGQDNVGKIILALLSFKRLKEQYKEYKGGLIVIDELDTTMYPASQHMLLKVLREYASKLSIQVIFTTHSLFLLEEAFSLKAETSKKQATKDQIKIVFLQKTGEKISIKNCDSFEDISYNLNATTKKEKTTKIDIFTEDKEAMKIAKNLLGRKFGLNYIDITCSCSILIDFAIKKVPSFSFPNSIIVLDGDVKEGDNAKNKIKKVKNITILPSKQSPERMLATFLYDLSEQHELWGNINQYYTKQICFKYYKLKQIKDDRKLAKAWFNEQYKEKGWFTKTMTEWKKQNKEEVDRFINEFTEKYNVILEYYNIK